MQKKTSIFFLVLGVPTYGEGGGGRPGWDKRPNFSTDPVWGLPLVSFAESALKCRWGKNISTIMMLWPTFVIPIPPKMLFGGIKKMLTLHIYTILIETNRCQASPDSGWGRPHSFLWRMVCPNLPGTALHMTKFITKSFAKTGCLALLSWWLVCAICQGRATAMHDRCSLRLKTLIARAKH